MPLFANASFRVVSRFLYEFLFGVAVSVDVQL